MREFTGRSAWVWGVALIAASPAHAGEVSGFAELRVQWDVGVDGAPVSVVERLRPEFTQHLGERLALSGAVELGLHQGRDLSDELEATLMGSELAPLLEQAGCAWPQQTNEVLDVSDVSDYLSVERLYFDVFQPRYDLRVGRQALHWGSAMIVNPTDPFPEVLATQPWRPRAGVNAARASVPLGSRGQLGVVAGTNDAFTEPRLAARATAGVGQTDLSLVGAWRPEANSALVGADLRGTLGVGFWLEGAVHLPTGDEGEPYEELAIGLDYSLPVMERLVVSAQYYRNGAGGAASSSAALASSAALPECTSGALFPEGEADPFAPVFSGTDYLMATVALGFTPDVSASLVAIQNLGDGSATLVPMISATPSGWLELALSAQIGASTWGEGGEFNPPPEALVIEVPTEEGVLTADLSGLVPAASVSFWSRVSF